MWAAATSPTATPPSMWWTSMNKGIAPPPSGRGQRPTVLLAAAFREPGLDLPLAHAARVLPMIYVLLTYALAALVVCWIIRHALRHGTLDACRLDRVDQRIADMRA